MATQKAYSDRLLFVTGRNAAAMTQVMINFLSPDGTEHDELWESLDAWRNWALGIEWRGVYRVYEQDEDGDWLPVLTGRIEPTSAE